VHDHSLELLGLSECGMIYLEGQRLPHRRAERLVGRLFGIVVELQRALNRVDEPAKVLPPATRGIVGRDLNLFRLLLRQHGIATQAGNESRGSALHQIDLGSEARLLRHLLLSPPYLDFLTAEFLGDGANDPSREPLEQLPSLGDTQLLRLNPQSNKKSSHLAALALHYPAPCRLELYPHGITLQRAPGRSTGRGTPGRPNRTRQGRPRWSRHGSVDR